jgi:aspartyl-tRNA(Asn)/glutamyl-tRNA(Gln) amidotransferase subunit A
MIVELNQKLRSKELTPAQLVEQSAAKIAELDPQLHVFVSQTLDLARKAAELDFDFDNSLIAGIPTAIKDNFNWEGTVTTASSKMLENYVSPYTSTVVERLLQAQSVIVGKTNMDAFAHGSSTATSDFFTTRNPVNPDYYPGGSSGGSAAAVASGMVSYAIGSETAGSIRQPASWCGIVGMTPTYGRLSRYGVIAMGSSLDRPGVLATTVADTAIVIDTLSGKDRRDATSGNLSRTELFKNLSSDIKGKKIGLPRQYWDDRIDKSVLEQTELAVKRLEQLGAELVEIDLLDPKYAIAVYTIVCRSEVSSNLARLDGIRYGYSSQKHAENVLEQIANNRGEGLGMEAKQRSLTGAYTLSAGYYDAYYKKAQQVRNLIKLDMEKALTTVDVIMAPTSPTTALKIGDPRVEDSLFGELSDVLVEASALSGMPSLNIPVGFDEHQMPVGMQIIGRQWDEQTILNWGFAYEAQN